MLTAADHFKVLTERQGMASLMLQAECTRARYAQLRFTGWMLGRGEDGILEIFSLSGRRVLVELQRVHSIRVRRCCVPGAFPLFSPSSSSNSMVLILCGISMPPTPQRTVNSRTPSSGFGQGGIRPFSHILKNSIKEQLQGICADTQFRNTV